MKFLLVIIAAAGVYAALNWDMISSKLDNGINDVTELKHKADDLSEDVHDKIDSVKEQADDAKEKMDDAKDSFEKLIEKVK